VECVAHIGQSLLADSSHRHCPAGNPVGSLSGAEGVVSMRLRNLKCNVSTRSSPGDASLLTCGGAVRPELIVIVLIAIFFVPCAQLQAPARFLALHRSCNSFLDARHLHQRIVGYPLHTLKVTVQLAEEILVPSCVILCQSKEEVTTQRHLNAARLPKHLCHGCYHFTSGGGRGGDQQ
jgi:hypothetical protein